MKKEFIESEIWMLTVGASFQHANVYKPNVKLDAIEKKYFKNMLHGFIKNLVESRYSKIVNDEDHIQNIRSVSEFSKNDATILTNGKLNFGVSQKMLNLYLKYHWCLGNIPTPPHFPVDRIIQQKLKLNPIAWTQMDGEKGIQDYRRIIAVAKEKLNQDECKNVAELELMLFERN
jgi:hypothetical protein